MRDLASRLSPTAVGDRTSASLVFRFDCGFWLFSVFYICPECKRHINHDRWPTGPQLEAEMPAESEDEDIDDALATERIRESAHDVGLGWDTKVKEKRPCGPQGEYVERGGQQGISAARQQAVASSKEGLQGISR